MALAQCNIYYFARQGTQPYLQSNRAKGVSAGCAGTNPSIPTASRPGPADWELALASL